MTVEREQTWILKRLANFLPSDLLPVYSYGQLNQEKLITNKEKNIIEQIKKRKEMSFDSVSYSSLKESFKSNEKSKKKEGLVDKDIEALAYLTKKFEETYKITPFDEQLVTLIRTVDAYKNPEKGKIFELKTSEGKSSVIVPIALSYLGLREDNVQVHLTSPYLVKRDYERFYQLAETLGIKDEVAQLETSKDSDKLKKRFVFGLWSDFIHACQSNFFQSKHDFPANPTLVLDEIDQICFDEMVTPAVISSPINIKDFINQFLGDMKKEAKKSSPWSFILSTGEMININPKKFQPTKEKVFINDIQNLFKAMSDFIEANKDKIKSSDPRDIRRFLSDNDNFSFYQFCQVIGSKSTTLDWSTEEKSNKNFIMLRKLFNKTDISFWWDNNELQEALITAFTLRKGVDYERIMSPSNKNMTVGALLRLPVSTIEPSTAVKSISTGYKEKNKQHESLINYLLYIKEGIEPPKEINGPSTDSLQVSNFYQSFNKILGFTGTASTVAKRLYEVYGFGTQLIPEHFQTQRIVETRLIKNFSDKIITIYQEIAKRKQNSIIIVESTEQAKELEQLISLGNPETKVLSALNENEDSQLYSWISSKGDKPRILICVKMVGRGVNLQPDEKIKQEGLFLLTTTPFEFERTYQQLIGRVGRRGERGEVLSLISPDNNVFSRLSTDEIEKLKKSFQKNNLDVVEKYLKTAWNRWENNIIEEEKIIKTYYRPIMKLRNWLEGKANIYKELNEEENKKMRDWLKSNWGNWLWYFDQTYKSWKAIVPLGPFGQGNEEAIWNNHVLSELKKEYKKYVAGNIPM